VKTLFLLRHAESSRDDPALADFDRALNARGRDDALRVGRALAQLPIGFDRILASPARRVVETLEQLAAGYGQPLEPTYEAGLYQATAASLIDLARSCARDADSLLLVGHNPAIHELALGLTGDERLCADYPTAALAEILLHGRNWSELDNGGKLGRFIRPRDFA